MTGHHQPDYRLNVDGQDITSKLGARLIELRLRECRGGEADTLEITLDDADRRMAIPPKGARIALTLGWAGGAMYDKGEFVVDEVDHSGSPDRLTIHARAADMGRSLNLRASNSYHETTLGQIVREVAARGGLPAHIDPELDARPVEHVDQTGESDLNFINRLARQHDAVCSIKKGRLVFLRTDSRTTASGAAISAIEITRQDGDQHRWHSAERSAYGGIRARWHSKRRAQTMSGRVGGGRTKTLKDTYASRADARRAARAELRRVQRGAATFSLTLALARPEIMPQSAVTVSGFKPEIDGEGWLVVSVEHSLGDGGFTTRIEMELQGSAPDGDAPPPADETDPGPGDATGDLATEGEPNEQWSKDGGDDYAPLDD
ncbi:MAG: contractile injection system protein, VgrG/Pvc8 family [Desulfovibrionaceae bacterium]|nr:contractile injection system protein, VgrG/Pvc8 family [Desulfovibrionaceae bacterium]